MSNSNTAKDVLVRGRQEKTQQLKIPFTITGTPGAAPALGTAANFAVVASSTITNTGATVVNGSLALYPGTSVTGFPPGAFTGTEQVANGAANQAEIDATAAYTALQAKPAGTTESALGGLTLSPGTYTSASSMSLTGNLTLNGGGNPNAVFIFQMGSTLTTASASSVTLTNGAQAGNVFWQVGSSATFGTTTAFQGNVFAQASITFNTGATLVGSAYALTGAVTLAGNTITPSATTAPSDSVAITTYDLGLIFFKTQFTDQITPALSAGDIPPTFATQNDAAGNYSIMVVINEPIVKVCSANIVRRIPGVSGEEISACSMANTPNGIILEYPVQLGPIGIYTTPIGQKIVLNAHTGENLALNSVDATLELSYRTQF